MLKFRLVMADVDGVLIAPGANGNLPASERLIRAVSRAKEKGIIFSVATARSLDKISGLIKSLKLNSLIILDNGASIYDCMVKTYIFNSFIPPNSVRNIIKTLKEFPFKFYLDGLNKRLEYKPNVPVRLNEVIKIVILDIAPREAQQVFEEVYKNKNLKVTKSVSGVNPVKESIHITNFDASKEKALKRVADLSGVHLDEVMTIGDSYNDYYLMNTSGFKVAVENAVPEILAIADYIAPPYDKDGVAHVLEKFSLEDNV